MMPSQHVALPATEGPGANRTLTRAELDQCSPRGSGRRVRALCPFHGSDHQRSFEVNVELGRFHCFSCGTWGYLREHRDARRSTRTRTATLRIRCSAPPDWTERVRQLADAEPAERLADLAKRLSVTVASLRRLDCFRSTKIDAWCWPMRYASGQVVGVRTLHHDGAKRSVPGSRACPFMPARLGQVGPVLLVEGPSDVAALLDLGFDSVIGRSSARPANDLETPALRQLCKGRDALVIVENDRHGALWPGLDGARATAGALLLHAQSVSVVRLPERLKDPRDVLRVLGVDAAREVMERAIEAAEPFELRLRAGVAP